METFEDFRPRKRPRHEDASTGTGRPRLPWEMQALELYEGLGTQWVGQRGADESAIRRLTDGRNVFGGWKERSACLQAYATHAVAGRKSSSRAETVSLDYPHLLLS